MKENYSHLFFRKNGEPIFTTTEQLDAIDAIFQETLAVCREATFTAVKDALLRERQRVANLWAERQQQPQSWSFALTVKPKTQN